MFRKLLTICIIAALSACAGTKAAYQAAGGDLVKQAFVVTEHYSALLREAADLKEAGAQPEVVAALQAADSVAQPIILKLGPLAQAYERTRSAEDQVALQAAVNDAVVALTDFINAIKRARL